MASASAGSSLCTPLPVSARDLEHRRVADEVRARADLVGDVGPVLGVEQLPLVEQHDDRAAGGVDALGEALVLAR